MIRKAVRDVRIRYAPATGGRPVFADIAVDFEPLSEEDAGLQFVNLATNLPDALAEAVAEGLSGGLAEGDQAGGWAVRAVLTRARWHQVCSRASAFRTAGRLAAREAVRRLGQDGL